MSDGETLHNFPPIPYFGDRHLDVIKQAKDLPSIQCIHLLSYHLRYQDGFFNKLAFLLNTYRKNKLLLQIFSLVHIKFEDEEMDDEYGEDPEILKQIFEPLKDSKIKVLFRIFDGDFYIAEETF